MMRLAFAVGRPLRILCLGAHCDDIEIACGGTLLRLIAEGSVERVDWVVVSSNPQRALEAKRGAAFYLSGLSNVGMEIMNFRDGYLPYYGRDLKDAFEDLKQRVDPDLIFTHHRDDLHQDHRLLAELTWNSFRNHLILEAEIPKYDGDCFNPNVFVPLHESVCQRKVDGLLTVFESQRKKHWFTRDTFMSTLRLRGIECASSTNFAEAFVCRKAVV